MEREHTERREADHPKRIKRRDNYAFL